MVSGFSGATLDLAAINHDILIALGSPSDIGTNSKGFVGCVRKDAEYWECNLSKVT